MQQTLTNVETKPRSRGWLVLLDYLFYILLVAFLAIFVYYFYSYRQYVATYLPSFIEQGAVTTIYVSIISMILATIFGFIGALGRLSRFFCCAGSRWSMLKWYAARPFSCNCCCGFMVSARFWVLSASTRIILPTRF